MLFSSSNDSQSTIDVDLLVLVVADPADPPKVVVELDGHLDGALARELDRGLLTVKGGGSTLVTGGANGPGRVLLLGPGTKETDRSEALRLAGGAAAGRARQLKARRVGVVASGDDADGAELAAFTDGFALGAYRIHHHRGEPTGGPADTDESGAVTDDTDDEDRYDAVDELVVIGAQDAAVAAARRAHRLAEATNWARDLANAPANLLPPVKLAELARDLAGQHEHLTFRELDRAGIVAEGMGLFAGVAQGSADEPRLIVLEWNPPGAHEADDARLALVGKAVTFDTGGISIKPVGGMEDMKRDKSGGCAVVGAMRAIAELEVPRRVLALVGATTNMPDGNAYRPGDVLTAKDGTTVEIISTDAEGRLVLADAITYARQLGCGAIVEASTLTGAMVVALGARYAGCIAHEGELVDAVTAAAGRTGDHAWHLPMHEEYRADLKCECADIKNSGGRGGGALSAGIFLQHFAKDTPFAHLDVAGAGMLAKPRAYFGCGGATGWGVRLLADLAATR